MRSSSGSPVTQAVTMLTDGGDSVCRLVGLVGELLPGAVHIIDWFHIAMRLTRLDQYVKGLAHHNPVEALALEHRLKRIKWRLWHGDDDAGDVSYVVVGVHFMDAQGQTNLS